MTKAGLLAEISAAKDETLRLQNFLDELYANVEECDACSDLDAVTAWALRYLTEEPINPADGVLREVLSWVNRG